MRSSRSFAVILVILFWAFTWSVAGWSQSPDPWAPYRSVAEIRMPRWTGSGTLVATSGGKGLVLSCRHVNPRVGMRARVRWLGVGAETIGVVVKVVRGRGFGTDLALLVTDIPGGVLPRTVAAFDPQNGPWRSVGYRDSRLLEATAERVDVRGNLLYLNSPYLGGMSGGPTFDRFGQVVAVVVASNGDTVGVSVDGEALHDMLREFAK